MVIHATMPRRTIAATAGKLIAQSILIE